MTKYFEYGVNLSVGQKESLAIKKQPIEWK